MTRLEKNTIVRKRKLLITLAYVSLLFFIIAFIIMMILKPIPIVIAVIVPITLLGLSLVLLMYSLMCETRLTVYRRELKQKRHENLLRIAVKAAQSGNFKKAVDIHKIMTDSYFEIFLNGYNIFISIEFTNFGK